MSLEVLKQLEADKLLQGTHILTKVQGLKNGVRYKTDGTEISFDDFWKTLIAEINDLPKLNLKQRLAPGTEDAYLMELASGLEAVYDNADRCLDKLLYFEAKLGTAVTECKNIRASFTAWYTLALDAKLKELDTRLPGKNIAALAESEFDRLIEGVEADLESLQAIVQIQGQKIKNAKKLALNKYKLGQDQANATWTSSLPPRENGYGNVPDALLSAPEPEEENDEVPTFISKREIITPLVTGTNVPSLPQEPVTVKLDVFSQPSSVAEPEIKGTFKKELPPVALTPVHTDVLMPNPEAMAQPNPTLAAKLATNAPISAEDLSKLVDGARTVVMTEGEKEEQRRSFAAGSLAISQNRPIEEVREDVDAAADELAKAKPVEAPVKKKPIIISVNKPTHSFSNPDAPASPGGRSVQEPIIYPVVPPKPKVAVKVELKKQSAPVATVTAVNSEQTIASVPAQPIVVAPAPILENIIKPVPVPVPSLPPTPRKPLQFIADEDEAVM